MKMKVASLLLLPFAASAFHIQTGKSSQTVVQKAITSKWTMMPEEPEPEVSSRTASSGGFHASVRRILGGRVDDPAIINNAHAPVNSL